MRAACAIALLLLGGALARANEAGDFDTVCAAARGFAADGKWERALAAWQAAYAERQEPRLLYEIARAEQKLGLLRRAESDFRAWQVAADDATDGERAEVAARLTLLRAPPPLPPGVQWVPMRTAERRSGAMIGGGIALSVIAYLPALITGALLLGDSYFHDGAVALFIPLVGPFLSAALYPQLWWSLPWVFLDGAAQVVGLALTIAGTRKHTVKLLGDHVVLAPFATPAGGGFSAFGSF